MQQTRDEITQNLAERMCWEVACRDNTRIARRLYWKQVVDGVYRLDEGAVLDDFFHFLQSLGEMALLEQASGAGVHRAIVPFVQYVLLYGLKTLFGIESINALPTLAKNIVKWNLRDLELVFNGAIRALAKAGVFGKQVTGIADGTDLETTERL
jgi:hypothetical protein